MEHQTLRTATFTSSRVFSCLKDTKNFKMLNSHLLVHRCQKRNLELKNNSSHLSGKFLVHEIVSVEPDGV